MLIVIRFSYFRITVNEYCILVHTPTLFHFPRITFEAQEKKLWNSILKKAYKNLPEERVRLQFVDWLLEETDFPKSRISFESPVKLPRDKINSRTDIICYDSDFKPLLLVECKAPEVRLDAKVALQIARYNQEVEAPYLAITNGNTVFWFDATDTLSLLEEPPKPFDSSNTETRDFQYWSEHGFLGKNTNPEIRPWLVENCTSLFLNKSTPSRYFSFEGTDPDLGLPNYYHVAEIDESKKLAISFTATAFGVTKMNAILNHSGENVALLSASMELLASEETANTFIQSAAGMHTVDLVGKIGFNFEEPLDSLFDDLAELMLG